MLQSILPGSTITVDGVPRGKEGDYATSIALKLAAEAGAEPMAKAAEIAGRIEETGRALVSKTRIYPPGFINMSVHPGVLLDNLRASDADPDVGGGRSVLVEFVSANPTGPINIVSARAAAFGDALVRLLKTCGYRACSEYYVNDSGNQVDLLGESVRQRMLELAGGKAEIPEQGYHGSYLVEVARQAAAKGLTDGDGIKSFALEYFVANHRATLERFGIVFDFWTRESRIRSSGAVDRTLDYLKTRNFTYEEDGAVFFRSTDFGDQRDRVIVTRDRRHTYLLPDIAYHLDKIDRGFESLITVLGPDHAGQVASLTGALKAFGCPDGILRVLIVQEVKLKKAGRIVSMSKRAGEFAELTELLASIPVDVARFFFLMRSSSQHLDFDLDLAMVESEENPVYYVQYGHARIRSILEHAAAKGIAVPRDPDLALLVEPEEWALIKQNLRLPEICEDAVRNLDPYPLTYYLLDLARIFHSFYQLHRVVTDDRGLTGARLYLVTKTAETIKKGLSILGISCPERM